MECVETIAEVRERHDAHRRAGRSIGLVPTMGFLHAGHQSLMRAAAASNDEVTATIFVNPLQFAADEDLDSYPRDLDNDLRLAEEAGATLVFTPSVDEMYPHGPVMTSVSVDALGADFEGATRPTHFAGMATVVTKLFSIAGPCSAYFGEKDFQQLAIIRRFVSDLSIPVEVVGCPIVREDDGLAMSSRNTYLEGAERTAATVLKRALDAGAIRASTPNATGAEVEAVMADIVAAEPLATLDYAAMVDASTLARIGDSTIAGQHADGGLRLLIAAQVGRPRLLDNLDPHPETSAR